jgi:alkanesulfonate monooxygenase SsuD/methylene tetrahydromethanopterin reductase-like flavin-dependent oxidoreductase (luciferase family)
VAAAVAARTATIRIGTNISLIGLKHPMQVVEEFHSLDAISGGRAVAGVGLGYQEQDFSMFDRDVRDRVSLYEDALTVLNLAREQEVISYQGRHCSFTGVKVIPRPTQPGGPPILMGTSTRSGARRAARLGDGLLLGGLDGLDGLSTIVEEYTAHAERNNRTSSVTLNRWAAIGDSRSAARAVLEPHAMKAMRYYFRHGSTLSAMMPAALRSAWSAAKNPAELTFDDFEELFVCGTPDECVERLELLRKTLRLNRIVLQIRSGGGPAHEVVLDQIRRFGTAVIPHFR